MLTIEISDPRHPEATRLLDASHTLLRALSPPEETFFLTINELCTPHVTLWTARIGPDHLGIVALARCDGYAEVKSLFTIPDARGKGVASALLRQAEDHARGLGIKILRLETGRDFDAALRLYLGLGFTRTGPFGAYPDIAASVFMEKQLIDPRP